MSVLLRFLHLDLQTCLPSCISKNQSAFVIGRRIGDNILLAQEIVHNYHTSALSPRCTIKIDTTKAFDSVSWELIQHVLQAFSIPAAMSSLIMTCISTPYFSVMLNGRPKGLFPGKRGLRQGDPLSPYLFIMRVEVLSKLLDQAANERKVGYHPNFLALKLTHLTFVDDLVIFTDAKLHSLTGLKYVLDKFYSWSGLKVNFEKSEIFFSGVFSVTVIRNLIDTLGIKKGSLPVRY